MVLSEEKVKPSSTLQVAAKLHLLQKEELLLLEFKAVAKYTLESKRTLNPTLECLQLANTTKLEVQ